MSPQITDDDVGKSVVNADGDEVGMVADVNTVRPTSNRIPESQIRSRRRSVGAIAVKIRTRFRKRRSVA